jgi:hypothetical protein
MCCLEASFAPVSGHSSHPGYLAPQWVDLAERLLGIASCLVGPAGACVGVRQPPRAYPRTATAAGLLLSAIALAVTYLVSGASDHDRKQTNLVGLAHICSGPSPTP